MILVPGIPYSIHCTGLQMRVQPLINFFFFYVNKKGAHLDKRTHITSFNNQCYRAIKLRISEIEDPRYTRRLLERGDLCTDVVGCVVVRFVAKKAVACIWVVAAI